MKRGSSQVAFLCLVLAVSLAFALSAAAQGSKDKPLRLEGTIQRVSKDTSTITLLEKSKVPRPVLYNAKTQITFRNKPGTVDMLKEGARVICLGNETAKKEFLATRIDIRQEK